jgi:hypothetical protein
MSMRAQRNAVVAVTLGVVTAGGSSCRDATEITLRRR